MPNDFEKQVRDKMDALFLEPSAPVWEKVELQIRQKKERRRLLFWLPLLFLLLAGGSWWLLATKENKGKTTLETGSLQQPAPSVRNEEPMQHTAGTGATGAGSNVADAKPVTTGSETASDNSDKAPVAEASVRTPNSVVLTRKKTPGTGTSGSQQGLASETSVRINTGTPSVNRKRSGVPVINETVPAATANTTTQGREESTPTKQTGIAVTPATPAADSVAKTTEHNNTEPPMVDSVLKKKVAGTKKDPWKWGLTAGAGFSGVGTGIRFADKSVADVSTMPNTSTGSGTPLVSRSPAAPVKNGFSFMAGAVAQKQLSERFRISTGIEYRYYSSLQPVGQYLSQDTTLSNGNTVGGFFANTGSRLEDYRNQMHVLSVPVTVGWKLHKQLPLYLEAGLALQQAISTRGILYDPSSQVYYDGKDLIRKTSVLSRFGLRYELFGKGRLPLAIGPELQYGISTYDRSGSGTRLFSFGLNARVFFQKK